MLVCTTMYLVPVKPLRPTIRGSNEVKEGSKVSLMCIYPHSTLSSIQPLYGWSAPGIEPVVEENKTFEHNAEWTSSGIYTCAIIINDVSSDHSEEYSVTGNITAILSLDSSIHLVCFFI